MKLNIITRTLLIGLLVPAAVAVADDRPLNAFNVKPTEAVFCCSMGLGEENPSLKIEKTKTSKADLIGALKDAFAYCDKAYNGMTDASGNIVTYLRLKNIVPPSSEQPATPQPKK